MIEDLQHQDLSRTNSASRSCKTARIASLDSLYSKYPNRTIKTAQGWPINRSYWSGSSSGSLTGGKPRSY
ncbi:DUF823 domain-containing adhesin, partial [Salmonella enterica subsp. enterica serovar Montevideo]|nr:DUF823 domain-containing adhesin [Salmonella enterica subsp. enterica serovar Montevideo]